MSLYLSQKKLLLLLIGAFLLGFALCLVYDLFRLARRHRHPKRRLWRFLDALAITLEDLLFFLFCGVVASILFFVLNSGKVRPSAFLAGACGFALCRVTLSRVFLFLAERILALVRRVVLFLLDHLVLPPLRFLGACLARVIKRLALHRAKRRSEKTLEKLKRLGQNGYQVGLTRL